MRTNTRQGLPLVHFSPESFPLLVAGQEGEGEDEKEGNEQGEGEPFNHPFLQNALTLSRAVDRCRPLAPAPHRHRPGAAP